MKNPLLHITERIWFCAFGTSPKPAFGGLQIRSAVRRKKILMHPYQGQINRMWDLIKRKISAQKNGCWMESIDLSYILLEIELRLLLSSKAGNSGIPIRPRKIDDQDYLMNLANLAKDNGFVDKIIWKRIKEFNHARKKAIHGLAQGEISYDDLKEPALSIGNLIFDIQSRWLPIEFGPQETRPSD